jgi:hypothetical protein
MGSAIARTTHAIALERCLATATRSIQIDLSFGCGNGLQQSPPEPREGDMQTKLNAKLRLFAVATAAAMPLMLTTDLQAQQTRRSFPT